MVLRSNRFRKISGYDILVKIDSSPDVYFSLYFIQRPWNHMDHVKKQPVIRLESGVIVRKFVQHRIPIQTVNPIEDVEFLLTNVLGEKPSSIHRRYDLGTVFIYDRLTGDDNLPVERSSIYFDPLSRNIRGELGELLRKHNYSYSESGFPVPVPHRIFNSGKRKRINEPEFSI